jgi:protocatechuate 3,4-dioxygenase beta subunit
MSDFVDLGRRRFIRAALVAPVILGAGSRIAWGEWAAAVAAKTGSAPAPPASPTPECTDGDEPTPAETQGPFFKPSSPLRRSLIEPGIHGTHIVVTGRVFSRECRPIPNALLDFWHADDEGEYDNQGFHLRGHQFTDEEGRYRLETIVPGLYPGRTRHFHVKVQAAHGRVLTTQLYFPGEARNERDGLFRPDLLMKVAKGSGQGRFHFMLDPS